MSIFPDVGNPMDSIERMMNLDKKSEYHKKVDVLMGAVPKIESELRSLISELHHLRVEDNLKRDQEDVRLMSSISILVETVDTLRQRIEILENMNENTVGGTD